MFNLPKIREFPLYDKISNWNSNWNLILGPNYKIITTNKSLQRNVVCIWLRQELRHFITCLPNLFSKSLKQNDSFDFSCKPLNVNIKGPSELFLFHGKVSIWILLLNSLFSMKIHFEIIFTLQSMFNSISWSRTTSVSSLLLQVWSSVSKYFSYFRIFFTQNEFISSSNKTQKQIDQEEFYFFKSAMPRSYLFELNLRYEGQGKLWQEITHVSCWESPRCWKPTQDLLHSRCSVLRMSSLWKFSLGTKC